MCAGATGHLCPKMAAGSEGCRVKAARHHDNLIKMALHGSLQEVFSHSETSQYLQPLVRPQVHAAKHVVHISHSQSLGSPLAQGGHQLSHLHAHNDT